MARFLSKGGLSISREGGTLVVGGPSLAWGCVRESFSLHCIEGLLPFSESFSSRVNVLCESRRECELGLVFLCGSLKEDGA
ncbi:hypothetical protein F2Q70_00010849 [Brassica cretica]|uniref:Uncharacterized protein n=1 Tax=Brassica cretica TaxID=69181 RepID=A0A8S9M474_BRACR|nr:hypothetical protein F2Q70_00010849 [Brassica cretica]